MPRLEKAYIEVGKAKETANALSDARKHMLRLGVMCTIAPTHMTTLLEKLRNKVPDLVISLLDAKSSEVVELLLADEIDIGMSAWPEYPEEIAPVPLFRERFAVAFAKGHAFEKLPAIALGQLAGENYLDRLGCEFNEYYAFEFGDWTIDMNVRFSSEREDWIQAMIKAGAGCSIVPEFTPLLDGIATRPLTEPSVIRQVSLLTARGRIFFCRLRKPLLGWRWPTLGKSAATLDLEKQRTAFCYFQAVYRTLAPSRRVSAAATTSAAPTPATAAGQPKRSKS